MLLNIACKCLANIGRRSVKTERTTKVKMVVLQEAEQKENIMKT
jgi:hypothetical protein